MTGRKSVLVVVCLIAACAAQAQSQPSASPLTPDSAELYITFFQFHDSFSTWADQRKAANPKSAQSFDANVAKHFQVDPGDLGKMRGVTNSVIANFKNIDKDIAAHLNARAKYEQLGDPATLQGFLQRRQQAALDGVTQLQRTISAASWAGLHNYINNIHRLRFRTVAAAKH